MADVGERIEEDRGDYGEGHWKCASCQRVRQTMNLARVYVNDDYFLLCNGFFDASPTCYDKYQAGRKKYATKGPA